MRKSLSWGAHKRYVRKVDLPLRAAVAGRAGKRQTEPVTRQPVVAYLEEMSVLWLWSWSKVTVCMGITIAAENPSAKPLWGSVPVVRAIIGLRGLAALLSLPLGAASTQLHQREYRAGKYVQHEPTE